MGKVLLPPVLTGVRPASEGLSAFYPALHVPRADRVYLWTHEGLAEVWAAMHGAIGDIGWVYEVLPEGALEPDADPSLKPGASWQCSRARIISARALGVDGLAQVRDVVSEAVRMGGAS